MRPGFPVITALVGGAAALVFLAPPLQALLVYDRTRILDGELWRLFTGSWVHFSASHFVCDALGFAIAGALIERRGLAGFGPLCAATALLSGLAMLLFEPQFSRCGGLSALVIGAIVFLALHGLSDRGLSRWASAAALVAVAVKILMELSTERLLLVDGGGAMVPATTSHVAGVIAALLVFGSYRRWEVERLHSRSFPPPHVGGYKPRSRCGTAPVSLSSAHATARHHHRADAGMGKGHLGNRTI